ncbi:MAG: peptidase [Acidimicrobiia bacterium]|nr:peptidase [Acidimicrobiia bacterium]
MAAAVSVTPLASSASTSRSDGNASSTAAAVSERAAAKAVAYWTPARMRAAVPYRPKATPGAVASGAGVTRGAPVSVDGRNVGSAASDGGGPVAEAAVAVPRPYTNAPDKFNGKVFFSHGSVDYVCSGTLINNPTKNLVWTAGHCVADGEGDHKFHTNWVFVPAYNSNGGGQNPYGKWAASSLHTRLPWLQNGNFRQDVGAVVLRKQGGQTLGQKIGGQGITFNAAPQANYSDFGYPHAPPFNGQSQFRCNSPLVARDNPFNGAGPLTMKINCNMTGGSSGGGWVVGLNAQGVGHVESVNSYGYTNDSQHEYGPYQGNEALNLYNSVKNLAA